jgi:hypothetical protein
VQEARAAWSAHTALALLLGGYAAAFWVRLASGKADPRRASGARSVIACLALGCVALGVTFADPRILLLNVFWWSVSLLALVGVAEALGDRRHAVVVAEGMLVLVLLHAIGQTPDERRRLDLGQGNGVSWAFSFERDDQRIVKLFPRPETWGSPRHDTFVRADLARPYQGHAGYELWVNGRLLGKLHGGTGGTVWSGPGAFQWALRVPPGMMAEEPLVTVELRPDGIDPDLALAGHGDPHSSALGPDSTWLFDGGRWTRDRLAGPEAGPAGGTYRLWLINLMRPPDEQPPREGT